MSNSIDTMRQQLQDIVNGGNGDIDTIRPCTPEEHAKAGHPNYVYVTTADSKGTPLCCYTDTEEQAQRIKDIAELTI